MVLKNRTRISHASLFPPCGLSDFLWSSPTTRIQIDLAFRDGRRYRDSLLKSLPLILVTGRLIVIGNRAVRENSHRVRYPKLKQLINISYTMHICNICERRLIERSLANKVVARDAYPLPRCTRIPAIGGYLSALLLDHYYQMYQ